MWECTDLLPDHKSLGLKECEVEKNSEGNVIKHKEKLVVKGYVQRQGVDSKEIFAPVARLDHMRLIFAIVTQHGWQVHQLDVKSVFLNGDLQEEV